MLEALESDYARTAAAKGLSRRRVIRRHAAPPSYLTAAEPPPGAEITDPDQVSPAGVYAQPATPSRG